jgi:hypothetical protein
MIYLRLKKYLLSHPVCQIVTEFRKHFNKNTEININLQPNIHISQSPSSSINVILPTNNNDHEQISSIAQTRVPAIIDRIQCLIGHESIVTHPRRL